MNLTKADMIKALQLEPHPIEGGYFARTYESEENVEAQVGKRRLLTTIYYMLTDDSPVGYMHRNQSDIVHFWQGGSAMRYWIINEQGQLTEKILGPNITKGEQLQMVVKGGDWKLSRLLDDVVKGFVEGADDDVKGMNQDATTGGYGLLGEAVAPGFEYVDNEIATAELVNRLFPALAAQLQPFIKVF